MECRRRNRSGKSIVKTTTINLETGEYREKSKYIDSLFSKRGYVMKYNNSYIKMFLDKGLQEDCSLVECGKFYRLVQCIIGENQLLGYRSDKVRPLTVEKMSEMFKCSERSTRSFLRKMKKLKVIKEVSINGIKWYAVNPLYALKSKYLSLTTFIIFQDELIKVLPKWATNKFLQEVPELMDKIEVKE